jgi:hypothetical protein
VPRGHFVRELSDELLDDLLRRMFGLGRPPSQILVASLHGRPKETDPSTAVVGFRASALSVSVQADEPIKPIWAAFSDRDFARFQPLKGQYDPNEIGPEMGNFRPARTGDFQTGVDSN